MTNEFQSNYDKQPITQVSFDTQIFIGWNNIFKQLNSEIKDSNSIIAIDCYQGVFEKSICDQIKIYFPNANIIETANFLKDESEIYNLVFPYVTNDRVFGYMTRLHLSDYFDQNKIDSFEKTYSTTNITFIIGIGAQLIFSKFHLIIFADMARWEIQLRQRKNLINNIGLNNKNLTASDLYKHSFFVDWRVLDKYKKNTWHTWNYVLDTNISEQPKMISAQSMFNGLKKIVKQPFRLVPFFDPGIWGGEWMREVCQLEKGAPNYAWCFDGVPEENSLYLGFNKEYFEIPSINLVFAYPIELLGDPVHARFGDEFPIRFDFLDTFDGQNLSFQVHPLTEYIQEHFGMHYTQDESYYILDAKEDAKVYLGIKENANVDQMIDDLKKAQETGKFEDDLYLEWWPAKKHDHFLIPAGTVHCSGKNTMVLEISATPYIFTFKLWDWGRVGLDGKPRPINIIHGEKNIIKERKSHWVKNNLINQFKKIAEGDGWIEEKTGLHEREFIETRRHWFTKKVFHHTNFKSVHVLNLIEGNEIIIESPNNAFEPFIVHYAETFIIPASVGEYTISPYGKSEHLKCATIKAYVRT